jgi:hypothetical protein
MPGQRTHAHPRELVGQSEPVQDPRRVGTDLDSRPDLAQGRGLLEDVDVESLAQQRQCCRQAAGATPDDADGGRPPGLSVHPGKTLAKSGEWRSQRTYASASTSEGEPAVPVAKRG